MTNLANVVISEAEAEAELGGTDRNGRGERPHEKEVRCVCGEGVMVLTWARRLMEQVGLAEKGLLCKEHNLSLLCTPPLKWKRNLKEQR